MPQQYIVLGVRRYNFENDAKEHVEGCTVNFLDASTPPDDAPDRLGLGQMTLNGPLSLFEFFIASPPVLATDPAPATQGGGHVPHVSSSPLVPGIFELDMGMRPGPKNRPVSTLLGAKFIAPVNFEKFMKSSLKDAR